MRLVRTAALIALGAVAAPARANEWRDLAPAANAGRKDGHVLAYDSRSEKVVLFADHFMIDPDYEETWSYDVTANTWTLMAPASRPTPHAHGGMVYDSASDLIVLFGGQSDAGPPLGETWTYDVDADVWLNRMPPAPMPPAREWHSMSYDESCDRVILFGGSDDLGGSALGDTWAYHVDLNQWEPRSPPAPTPAPQFFAAMTYDAAFQRTLLATRGGETWSYDCAADRWELLTTAGPLINGAGAPIPRMAYDTESRLSILLGDDGVTWAYDSGLNTWTNQLPSGPTPDVHHHDLVYVAPLDAILLYGERSSTQPTGTWAYTHTGGFPVPDAGPVDTPDASADGGPGPDAGPDADSGGCDCSTAPRASDLVAAPFVLLLAVVLRRPRWLRVSYRPGGRRQGPPLAEHLRDPVRHRLLGGRARTRGVSR